MHVHPAVALNHVPVVCFAAFELDQLQEYDTLNTVFSSAQDHKYGIYHGMALRSLQQQQR